MQVKKKKSNPKSQTHRGGEQEKVKAGEGTYTKYLRRDRLWRDRRCAGLLFA